MDTKNTVNRKGSNGITPTQSIQSGAVAYISRPNIVKMGFEPQRLRKEYKNERVSACIGGKSCNFRSKLEYAVAKHLELRKVSGLIRDWAYEKTTFKFPGFSWLMDFDVLNADGTFEYYECKGHFEANTRIKIKALAQERPEVRVTIVFCDNGQKKKCQKWTKSRLFHRVCTLKEFTNGF